jgi:major outer membrane protein
MKKMSSFILILLIPMTACALPIGNPWEASIHCDGIFWKSDRCQKKEEKSLSLCDAWVIRLGYYGDFVFDRHLQIDTRESHAQIHEANLRTNAWYFALNFWDKLDFFGTLGTSHLSIQSSLSSFGVFDATVDYLTLDTDTYLSWSLGIRGTLWQWRCLGLGAEFQYFETRPHLNSASIAGVDVFYFNNNDRLKYREWQVGLGISYRVNIASCFTALIPYAGVKWGRCKLDMDNIILPIIIGQGLPTLFNQENDRDWGFAVGLTLLGCSKASITAEARFIAEKAFYINGQIRL